MRAGPASTEIFCFKQKTRIRLYLKQRSPKNIYLKQKTCKNIYLKQPSSTLLRFWEKSWRSTPEQKTRYARKETLTAKNVVSRLNLSSQSGFIFNLSSKLGKNSYLKQKTRIHIELKQLRLCAHAKRLHEPSMAGLVLYMLFESCI